MKILRKIERWLDLHVGWIFINGYKREAWQRYLRKKYKEDI
tara:strand:- start:4197 stop:4319 length:123 start_codon:yes stop_codon:yes gene_type:complete